MNIDTEKVINEVRARELLWDISHELYKDRDARLSAWQQICRQVVPNFGNMTAREQFRRSYWNPKRIATF